MSLTLVERPEKGSDGDGVWFLSGHNKDVLSIATDHGDVFATCDAGGLGLLWKYNISNRDSDPIHVSKITTEGPAIVDACFLRHTRLCTAQGDGTVGVWNVETAQREYSLCRASGRGRSIDWPVINAVTVLGGSSIAFGGDDGFLVLSDPAQKKPVSTNNLRVPITSITGSSDSLFIADVLGNIRCFDTRMLRSIYSFKGHRDVVSCVEISKDNTMMLSYGMDNSLALWDILPFAINTKDRLLHRTEIKQGDSRNLLRCSWSKKNTFLVPTGYGQVVFLNPSMLNEARVTLPVRHKFEQVQSALFVNDDVAVSSSGPEVIMQCI